MSLDHSKRTRLEVDFEDFPTNPSLRIFFFFSLPS
jgi:hypothetical protein